LDLTTRMVGRKKLLNLVNAVNGLYILTKAIPSVKIPDYDDLLEQIFIAVVNDSVDKVGGVMEVVKGLKKIATECIAALGQAPDPDRDSFTRVITVTLDILAEIEKRKNQVRSDLDDSRKFREQVIHYIAAPKFMLKAKTPYRAAVIVGPMNSGKTSFVKALLGKAVFRLLEHGIDESEIGFVHSYERNMSQIVKVADKNFDLKKQKYLYLFNDDAAASDTGNSRQSFTPEAIGESKYYIMIRHRLGEKGFNGFLFVFHATQIFSLLEKTFRNTADLFLFKYYPVTKDDASLIGWMVGKAGMLALAELSYKLRMPKTFNDFLEAVYTAVGKLIRSRHLVKAYDENPETDTNYYKAILRKINNATIEPQAEDEEETQITATKTQERLNKITLEILRYLRLNHRLKFNGDHIVLLLDGKKLTISRKYIPDPWIKKLKQIKVPRRKKTSFSANE